MRHVSRRLLTALPLVVLAYACAAEPYGTSDVPAGSGEAGVPAEAGGASDGGAAGDADAKDTGTPSTLTNGLVARWRFDENTGNVAANDVMTSPAGSLSGTTWVAGKIGAALKFDAMSSVVTVAPSPSLTVTSTFTMADWANLGASSPVGDQRFVAHAPIDFKLNGRRPQIGISATAYALSGYSLPEGEWHHIAATFANGTPHIYVDGVETTLDANTLAPGPGVPPQTKPLYIGSFGDGTGIANGVLDDVRMWNRALTPSEVLELFNAR